jgi:DNA invertase Pin-like site-specific DNA recombinase
MADNLEILKPAVSLLIRAVLLAQLEMQVSILQKHLRKKGSKPRYEVRERLLILWHLEAFQIPRRKVFRHFGIARSTFYRWVHKIEDQTPSGPAVPVKRQ